MHEVALKWARRFLGALGAVILFTSTTWAQGAGSIAGRIADANNGSSMAGVEVVIAETGQETHSARDGSYRFSGLGSGTYTVTFRYLGYDSQTLRINVVAGEVSNGDVKLGSEIVELPEFRVEGPREGQARALNQQKNAINLRNVVAADAIGNFPDHNVAESLQRLPGVYAESYLGEPRYISIRGAAPHQNSITMDGIPLLSVEQDIRTISLDVFPSTQVSSIEVVKAVTPDMDADSIGGAILMKGKSAFDTDRRVVVINGSINYNDLIEDTGYRGSISFADTFGAERDWGFQLSYSREEYKSWEQSNETNNWTPTTITIGGVERTGFVPATLLQSSVIVDRERSSLSAAVEKKLSNGTRVFLRGFRNTFDDVHVRDGLRYELGVTETGGNLDLAEPIEILPDGTFVRYTGTRVTSRRQVQPRTEFSVAQGFIGGIEIDRGEWGAEITAGYNRSTNEFWTSQAQWVSKANNNRAEINQTDSHFWRVNQLTGTDYFDPSGLRFQQGNNRTQFIRNKEWVLKADAHRTLLAGTTPVKLSAGYKSRWGYKYRDNNVAVWNGLIAGETLDLDDPRLGGNIVVDSEWLNGRYDFGPSVDSWAWVRFFEANRSTFDPVAVEFTDTAGIFTPNLNNSYNNSLQNDYSIDEDIHAGYLRADWRWGAVDMVAGVRYELTDLHLRAIKIDATRPNNDRSRYQPYSQRADYVNFLPGIHARYEIRPDFVLRASWTNTVARPLVSDMVPSFRVDAVERTISGGNPNLKATESMNWDFTAEYYLSSVGVASFGVFAKDLDGPIYSQTFSMEYDDGSGPQTYLATMPTNAGKARVRGVEASYQQQLRFLPSPFDGLGFYANITLVDSDVDIPERPNEKFTLFKQADTLGNLALFYQKYRVTARLAYTFRSDYLNELLLPGTDTYFDDDRRLDFQLSYKFNDHWSVTVAGKNLLNSPEKLFHGTRSRQEFYGLTGRIYSLGFSWEM